MTLRSIATQTDKKVLLQSIGVDKGALSILASKMDMHWIYIADLHVGAANILKQDALSVGADVAVPRGVIVCETPRVDVLVLATGKALDALAKKALAQPFGLKEVGEKLKSFVKPKSYALKLMGIINANDDSFYAGSRFLGRDAVAKIEAHIEEGADIIDIGAVSSRPGSTRVAVQEELARLEDILALIKRHKLYEQADFSIDSYTPEVIQKALDSGFKIVNDITGLSDDRVCEIASSYQAQVVIMHMQGEPQSMQNNPRYHDVVAEVDAFFASRIQKAQSYGIKDIVLDVGIGFGKRLEDNLKLLRDLDHFRHFGYELLVGASRKSMIDKILPTPTEARLPATLALHIDAVSKGASIIRCHDVLEHKRAFSITQALQSIQTL